MQLRSTNTAADRTQAYRKAPFLLLLDIRVASYNLRQGGGRAKQHAARVQMHNAATKNLCDIDLENVSA